MRFINCFLTVSAACGILFMPQAAECTPARSFGLDADTTAHAMAAAAAADAVAAAATNPARLVDVRSMEMRLGIVVSDDRLEVRNEDAGLDTYVGYQIGAAAAIPLGPFRDRLFIGLDIHLPHGALYEINNTACRDVVILGHGSDARRFTLDAALAVRIWQRISVGVGLHVIPDVSADVGIDFTSGAQNSRSRVTADCRLAPSAGIYAEPVRGLHLGFSYHAASRLSMDVPATVRVSESVGQIRTGVKGFAFSEPHSFALGIKYDFSSFTDNPLLRFAVTAEFEWRYNPNPVALAALVTLYDDTGAVLDGTEQKFTPFDQAYGIRAAADWMPADGVSVALGYAFEKTPVPAQRTIFNVLDADRHLFSFGTKLWCPESWMGSFGLGFATSAVIDFYDTRDVEKHEFMPSNPGFPSIRFGGMAFSWHAALMFRFE